MSTTDNRDSYEAGWGQILDLIRSGGSWSGHERNCCFLNTGAAQFADVSAVTGLDFLDDGRCVAVVDWDLDGDLDLWLSARTGPRLRFVRNDNRDADDPGNHFLAVKLTGTSCNRDAIGAQVELTVAGKKLIRTLHAGDGYLSQSSKWVHFGLGNDSSVERVRVRWPGGDTEEFRGLTVDARFELVQGDGQAVAWQIPQRQVELTESRLETRGEPTPSRLVMFDRIPLPRMRYTDFNDNEVTLLENTKGPVLVSLWATWCAPCLVELRDIKNAEQQLRESNLEVVALSVNGLGEGDSSDMEQARQFMQRQQFPFASGAANVTLLDKLDAFQDVLISLRTKSEQLPLSFLIDEFGRLAVIYPGPISVEQLLADVRMLSSSPTEAGNAAFPFAGRWFARPDETGGLLVEFAREFAKRKHPDDALRFASLAADLATRDGISPELTFELASIFFEAGTANMQQSSFQKAQRQYLAAVRLRPNWAEAHANLANAHSQLGGNDEAARHYLIAVQIDPQLLPAHFNLGVIRLQQRDNTAAVAHLEATVEMNPKFSEGYHYLGIALARLGNTRESARHLTTAVRLDPANAAAQRNLETVLAGRTP
jgi:tetratricopeptide (TPR) repeat protein